MFRPMGNKVLIAPDTERTISKGGIHMAAQNKDEPRIGTVVAAGTGHISEYGTHVPCMIQDNARVWYMPKSGLPIGQGYILVMEKDLLGIEEDAQPAQQVVNQPVNPPEPAQPLGFDPMAADTRHQNAVDAQQSGMFPHINIGDSPVVAQKKEIEAPITPVMDRGFQAQVGQILTGGGQFEIDPELERGR